VVARDNTVTIGGWLLQISPQPGRGSSIWCVWLSAKLCHCVQRLMSVMVHIRLALRTLFKTPFVTSVAIVSLALGIGANAAIFSLFNQLLLRPLPVHDPGQLVNLLAPGPKPGSTSCNQASTHDNCDDVFSYPMFRDLERVQNVFSGIAAHRLFGANLSYQGQTLNGDGLLVSGAYFRVLGLMPALGRLIDAGDDPAPGTGTGRLASRRIRTC
jgi:hypothetical protein